LIDSPAAVVPDVVEAAAKGGLQIETFTVTPRKVSVSGTARGWQSCDDLVMRLEKRGMRTRLDRREAREDLRVPFTLSAEAPDG
jgi:YbbR domain-containing protein